MTSAPDLRGALIDWRHRVRGPLAGDALGDVYEVDALRLERAASLKLYHGALASNLDAVERFLSELTTFARDPTLNGRILDFGFYEGRPYIVFDPSGQVVSPEEAIPRIRTLVDVAVPKPTPEDAPPPRASVAISALPSLSMSMGASLPEVEAELLASGPKRVDPDAILEEAADIEHALPPPPPPPSNPPPVFDSHKPKPPTPPPASDETPAGRAQGREGQDVRERPPLPPPTPPPLGLRAKPLPHFDEIEVPPDRPFFESGTIRVSDDIKIQATRAVMRQRGFWKLHGSAVKGAIVALYLLSGAGVVYYFAHGLPNAAKDARNLVRRGQTPQVIQQLEKYTTQPNADPSLHAALGYAFVYAKKPHKALAEYKAAIERDPTVLEPADIAAIAKLQKAHGDDGTEAAALLKRLDDLHRKADRLRPDPGHGTGN